MGTLSRMWKSGKRMGAKKPGRKGPRRRIVSGGVQTNIFSSVRATLECGHEANSWGGARCACRACVDAIDVDPEFRAALKWLRDGVRPTSDEAFAWAKGAGEAEARKLIDSYRDARDVANS